MKNLKISLTAIIFAIILTMSASVFAHGSQVDTMNSITMPGSLSNGSGNISTSLSGDMSYQFVETTADKYALLKKYETQYNLVNAYINKDANYDSLATSYEKTYNQTANGMINEYGIKFNEEGLAAIKGLWVAELPTYNSSNWTKASGKTISLDLSTFKGTKYYIGWVKIDTTYDAEAYKVTGTKKDDPKPDNNTPVDNTPVDNTPKNETPVKNTPTANNTTTTVKKDDTTTGKTIPHTGASSIILGLITLAGGAAGVSYRKYSKIK